MKEIETRELIRMYIEEENCKKRAQFNALGSCIGLYTSNQKN
jgi:hypothetical protein